MTTDCEYVVLYCSCRFLATSLLCGNSNDNKQQLLFYNKQPQNTTVESETRRERVTQQAAYDSSYRIPGTFIRVRQQGFGRRMISVLSIIMPRELYTVHGISPAVYLSVRSGLPKGGKSAGYMLPRQTIDALIKRKISILVDISRRMPCDLV